MPDNRKANPFLTLKASQKDKCVHLFKVRRKVGKGFYSIAPDAHDGLVSAKGGRRSAVLPGFLGPWRACTRGGGGRVEKVVEVSIKKIVDASVALRHSMEKIEKVLLVLPFSYTKRLLVWIPTHAKPHAQMTL